MQMGFRWCDWKDCPFHPINAARKHLHLDEQYGLELFSSKQEERRPYSDPSDRNVETGRWHLYMTSRHVFKHKPFDDPESDWVREHSLHRNHLYTGSFKDAIKYIRAWLRVYND